MPNVVFEIISLYTFDVLYQTIMSVRVIRQILNIEIEESTYY